MRMASYYYNGINSEIRYIEDGKIIGTVYGTYAPSTDRTIIFMDLYKRGKIVSTEIVGFTYGNEVENLKYLRLLAQDRALKAEFEGGLFQNVTNRKNTGIKIAL